MKKNNELEIAKNHFFNALNDLKNCADILRSDAVSASDEVMATEIAVTKAIEVLTTSGFLKPKPIIAAKFLYHLNLEEE